MPTLKWQYIRKRAILDVCCIELVAVHPLFGLDTSTHTTASFVVADLLEPEACGRGVQQAQKRKMLILRGLFRQLDHRSGLLKNLAAPIKHKMIMRCDFPVRNCQRCPQLSRC